MATDVADRGANKNDLIRSTAELLAKSMHRRNVFKAIYTKQTKVKSVTDLMRATGLIRTRVLDATRPLVSHEICTRVKVGRESGFQKVPFYQTHRDKILRAAKNPAARAKIPTKTHPAGSGPKAVSLKLSVRLPRAKVRAKPITIDDVDSFADVKPIPKNRPYTRMSEKAFKKGLARVLGERRVPKDWGGESKDLLSTRLLLNGRRVVAAFALKGPGKTGPLVPGKMGTNGDQIQRLSRCPAQVFIVQYWRDIEDSVLEQLEGLIQLKSYQQDQPLWYGIIDGSDSTRLIEAYPKEFAKK